MAGPAKPARRRRRPEEAEREILDAARRLLVERPAHEITVAALMDATTLSRKSFYVYFRDRYELVARLVHPLREERDRIVAALREDMERDAAGAGRRALLALARLYAEHGALLRALAEASERDADAGAAWRSFIEPVVAGHADMIRAGIERGDMTDLDPERTARALIGMNLHVFFEELVGRPDADVEGVVEALLRIWLRVLYGQP